MKFWGWKNAETCAICAGVHLVIHSDYFGNKFAYNIFVTDIFANINFWIKTYWCCYTNRSRGFKYSNYNGKYKKYIFTILCMNNLPYEGNKIYEKIIGFT